MVWLIFTGSANKQQATNNKQTATDNNFRQHSPLDLHLGSWLKVLLCLVDDDVDVDVDVDVDGVGLYGPWRLRTVSSI